jgi:hypothetical protein
MYIFNQEWTGRVAQVVDHLSHKCKALSSNPSTTVPLTPKKPQDWDRALHVSTSPVISCYSERVLILQMKVIYTTFLRKHDMS